MKTTETQILTTLRRNKVKYSRVYKTHCIASTFRYEQEKKGVLVYDEKLGMTVCRETGLVFNLLRTKNYDWIGDIIKGQITPDEVNSLDINPVFPQFKSDFEMLSEKNLKKVIETFGGKK
jgi:hypothetical protein